MTQVAIPWYQRPAKVRGCSARVRARNRAIDQLRNFLDSQVLAWSPRHVVDTQRRYCVPFSVFGGDLRLRDFGSEIRGT